MLLVIATLNICISGTLAFFQASGVSESRITTGVLDGTIIDEYTEPEDGVFPGDRVDRVINVRNDGTLDMVVRLKVDKSWEKELLDSDKIIIEFNTKEWFKGNDGYYYYKRYTRTGSNHFKAAYE